MARDVIRSSYAHVLLRWYCDVVLSGIVKFLLISYILCWISSISLINRYSLPNVAADDDELQIPEKIYILKYYNLLS